MIDNRQHHHSAAGLILLLATVSLLGAVTVAGVFLLTGQLPVSASPWAPPVSELKPAAINPALAVQSLAGAADQDVIDQALAAGELETAFSVLLYSSTLADQQRAAGLLQVARQFAAGHQTDRAALAARTAAEVAVLSPVMADSARAGALSAAGRLLAALGKAEGAQWAYEAAAAIATHSPSLAPTVRSVLLQGLATDLSSLGKSERAQALRGAAAADAPQGQAAPSVLPELQTPLAERDDPAWVQLGAAASQRQVAARVYVQALAGSAVAPERARQALETALINEDRLRLQVYSLGIAQSTDLAQRAAHTRARRDWLALKWRVAAQGFGAGLAPGWESQVQSIESALKASCEESYVVMRDMAASLPSALAAAQGAVELALDQLKLARLGLYPHASETDLLATLEAVSLARLAARNDGGLYVSISKEGDLVQFIPVTASALASHAP